MKRKRKKYFEVQIKNRIESAEGRDIPVVFRTLDKVSKHESV